MVGSQQSTEERIGDLLRGGMEGAEKERKQKETEERSKRKEREMRKKMKEEKRLKVISINVQGVAGVHRMIELLEEGFTAEVVAIQEARCGPKDEAWVEKRLGRIGWYMYHMPGPVGGNRCYDMGKKGTEAKIGEQRKRGRNSINDGRCAGMEDTRWI